MSLLAFGESWATQPEVLNLQSGVGLSHSKGHLPALCTHIHSGFYQAPPCPGQTLLGLGIWADPKQSHSCFHGAVNSEEVGRKWVVMRGPDVQGLLLPAEGGR